MKKKKLLLLSVFVLFLTILLGYYLYNKNLEEKNIKYKYIKDRISSHNLFLYLNDNQKLLLEFTKRKSLEIGEPFFVEFNWLDEIDNINSFLDDYDFLADQGLVLKSYVHEGKQIKFSNFHFSIENFTGSRIQYVHYDIYDQELFFFKHLFYDFAVPYIKRLLGFSTFPLMLKHQIPTMTMS
eukprot:TRINITY_DN14492_c0_g1_i1.p1 TRINITY_DN14492_c0_g1~~TRINITY_DN14492_c0_g1_i1.p1  ORF type:complete len:182 (-),score=26.34 TRINITY_DN14492_c0_g1_i1:247-792(-)